MKAVGVSREKREIRLLDLEAPQKVESPTGVLLRMLEVGICGTDKEIAMFQYGTPPSGSEYLIIGHESLAQVVETGPEVKKIKQGDLVVSTVRRPCPYRECVPCRAGRQDFCYTGEYTERGIRKAHGFMTEFVTDEEIYLHTVPASLRDVGVLVEPLTIAEKAIIQVGNVQDRLPVNVRHHHGTLDGAKHRALVLGAGPVGLLGAMVLASHGYLTNVYSREPEGSTKASIVSTIGGKYFSAETSELKDIAREIGNIDLIYEAAGASQLAFSALPFLGTNAIFVFTGVPGRRGPLKIEADQIMRNLVLNNQIVLGTVNAGADAYEAAIRDLGAFKDKWPDGLQSLITGRYPVEAYRDLLTGSSSGIKNVISFDSETSKEAA